ncbi:hypothetical protein ACQYRI_09660 [Salmonella enterica]
MTIPGDPITDAFNAWLEKEKARITPLLENATTEIDKINDATVQVVAQLNDKLDQIVAVAPEKKSAVEASKLKLNNMLATVKLWAEKTKNELATLL